MKKIKFQPERKEPRILTKVILVLPAILSLGAIGYIKFSQARTPTIGDGTFLSPPVDSGMLILALSVFTLGYVLFLLLMFSEEIKEFFLAKMVK